MKIAPTTRAPARPRAAPEPLAVIDDLGLAERVADMPTTDEAWLTLTGGGERRGLLAARLVACRDRCEQAMHATARGIHAVVERSKTDPPVPTAWISRLADLHVEEFESLCALDDAVHAAALSEPAWVDWPRGERPIDPRETSWARLSRIVGRRIQITAGLDLDDESYDRLCALDVEREAGDDDEARVRENSRAAIRWCVAEKYGQERTDG